MKKLWCLMGAFILLSAMSAYATNAPATWGAVKTVKVMQHPQIQAAPSYSGTTILDSFRMPNGESFLIVAEQYTPSWWRFWETPYIEVWARKHTYTCSPQDKQLATIKGTSSISKVKNSLCEVKEAYDTGVIVLGCTASTACEVCIASGCGGGVACGACVAACAYTFGGGAVDCVEGVMESVFGPKVDIDYPSELSEFGEMIIDQVCR